MKNLLKERFQKLAGIKSLNGEPQNEIFGLFNHFMEKSKNQKYGFTAEDMGGYIVVYSKDKGMYKDGGKLNYWGFPKAGAGLDEKDKDFKTAKGSDKKTRAYVVMALRDAGLDKYAGYFK
jgi:hypothetical protein